MTPNDHSLTFIDNAPLAQSTRYQYRRAAIRYLDTGKGFNDTEALRSYAKALSNPEIKFLSAAYRLWCQAQGIEVPPLNLARIGTKTNRNGAGRPRTGHGHIWLTRSQIETMLDFCDCFGGILGQSHKVVLATLAYTGVNRVEMVNARFDNITTLSDRFWLEIVSGSGESRRIPLESTLVELINQWESVVGNGRIARTVTRKKQEIRPRISMGTLCVIVARYGALIGESGLTPMDLRRSYADNCYWEGVGIDEIRRRLGMKSLDGVVGYLRSGIDE